MKRTLIIPGVIIGLLTACHPEENPDQLKAVNQSLEYVNAGLADANKWIYEELAQKQKDPETHERAIIWRPRANRVQQIADSVKEFIDNIKRNLVSQSDNLKKDYVELTKQLHNSDGIGQQLLNTLADFKESSYAAMYSGEDSLGQSGIKDQLSHRLKTIPLLIGYGDSLSTDQRSKYKKKWLEESFGRSSSLMAMIMLNKLESDVLVTEKELITYCNYRSSSNRCMSIDIISAVAVLSSSYVKAGQSIEVTAGMGEFTVARKPRIRINGKEVKVGNDATAVYKFIATGSPGKHTVEVTFEYINPDGSNASRSTKREYIIAE